MVQEVIKGIKLTAGAIQNNGIPRLDGSC